MAADEYSYITIEDRVPIASAHLGWLVSNHAGRAVRAVRTGSSAVLSTFQALSLVIMNEKMLHDAFPNSLKMTSNS